MDSISRGEVLFAEKCLGRRVRLDSRTFDQARECVCKANDLPLADASLHLRAGFTALTLSVVFQSSAAANTALCLAPANAVPDVEEKIVDFKLAGELSVSASTALSFLARDCMLGSNGLLGELHETLRELCVSALIEIQITQDDGNIFDLIFKGLHTIFTRINIPNIVALASPIPVSLCLPTSRTFAVLGEMLIEDPTHLEETALEARIQVFSRGRELLSVASAGPLKASVLSEVLAKISG